MVNASKSSKLLIPVVGHLMPAVHHGTIKQSVLTVTVFRPAWFLCTFWKWLAMLCMNSSPQEWGGALSTQNISSSTAPSQTWLKRLISNTCVVNAESLHTHRRRKGLTLTPTRTRFYPESATFWIHFLFVNVISHTSALHHHAISYFLPHKAGRQCRELFYATQVFSFYHSVKMHRACTFSALCLCCALLLTCIIYSFCGYKFTLVHDNIEQWEYQNPIYSYHPITKRRRFRSIIMN